MAIECNRSTVIAKLMGLDSRPDKQPPSGVKRCIARELHAKPAAHDLVQCSEPRRDRRLSDIMSPPHHLSLQEGGAGGERTASKDICPVQQEASRNGSTVDMPLSPGNGDDSVEYKKMMDHVLENFMEAKRLSLNNRDLLQSKEFSDALEVLSSNCDLFLKILRDPNSQLSRHLQGLQIGHLSSPGGRNTLPKPSRCASTTGIMERSHADQLAFQDKFPRKRNSLPQGTRIVVLKPGLGDNGHLRNEVGCSISLSSALGGSHPLEALTTNESRGAREVAKRITCQMQKTLSYTSSVNNYNNNNKRSETLSCLLSKECADDSSLFDGSEKESIEEECASLASQNTDPTTSQGSWDYINRRGSHYSASSSSLTQVAMPHLSESSIFREARRRLSERWLLVTSGKSIQEQRHVSRCSSTLAEMLSVSDKGEATDREESPGARTSGIVGDDNVEELPRNLQKSSSFPQSSPTYERDDAGFNGGDIFCFHVTGGSVHAAAAAAASSRPPKGSMSFLKGKVSNLFLSRKRRGGLEQSHEPTQENNHSGEVPCNGCRCSSTDGSSGQSPICSRSTVSGGGALTVERDDVEPDISLTKERLPLEKLLAIESNEEQQEQPSPVSVLQAPFEVDSASSSWSQSLDDGSHEFQHDCQHAASLPDPASAVSVGQCLVFDEDESNSTSYTEEESGVDLVPGARDADGGCAPPEWLGFVKTVLTWSGFGGGETIMTMLPQWHSAESPLDPALLCKLMERKEDNGDEEEEEEGVASACRDRRSIQMLLFNCINTALMELAAASLLDSCPLTSSGSRSCSKLGLTASSLTSQVVCHVKELLSPEQTWCWSGHQDHASLLASVTRQHAAADSGGVGWARGMELDVLEIGAEIQQVVLDELVAEVVEDVLVPWVW